MDAYEVTVDDFSVSVNTSYEDFMEKLAENTDVVDEDDEDVLFTAEDLALINEDGEFMLPKEIETMLSASGNYVVNVAYVDEDGNMGIDEDVEISVVEPVEEIFTVEVDDIEVETGITADEFLEEVLDSTEITSNVTEDVEVEIEDLDVALTNEDGDELEIEDELFTVSGQYILTVSYKGTESNEAKVTVSEKADKFTISVKDFSVSVNTTSENFVSALLDSTSVSNNGNEVIFDIDDIDFKAQDGKRISEHVTASGNFVLVVSYKPVEGVSTTATVYVTEDGKKVTPSENTTPSSNTVSPNKPNSLGEAVSMNIAGTTVFWPKNVPYTAQNLKKFMKKNSNFIYAMVNGQKVGVKSVSIKKGVNAGTATVTAIKFDNGTKLKKKDLGSNVTITIDPFEITNENAQAVLDYSKAKLNKKNQVKGLKCKFTNEAGITAPKAKKIPPKMTAYDSTKKTVTFSGNYKGTISSNLINIQ
jgi:hypothetical protein